MTPFPADRAPENSPTDHNLADFLRQNRPPVPPAAPSLEADILAAMGGLPALTSPPVAPRARRPRLWLVPPALAAGVIATFWGYHALTPVTLSEAELATIAALIDNRQPAWGTEPDWLGLLEL